MSSEAVRAGIAIAARDLGKAFRIYDRPQDRLRQALWRWSERRFYREFWALRHVSFDVRRGETLGIIGRNGSGKSTLLQIVCGTLTPTMGTVEVTGRVSALLELGAGFNPEFTGRENVRLSAAMLGLSRARIDAVYDSIVRFADIGDFIDQPVKTYSSGMQVRLAFAVAAHVDPQILIVDEALAVGDIFFQQKCIRYMEEDLAGVTKLLVTHDMHAVTTLADRVLVLDCGEVAFLGPPREAVAFYTKSMHDEAFRSPYALADSPPRDTDNGARMHWAAVPESSRSGAGEVSIVRVALTDEDGAPVATAQGGDALVAHLELHALRPKDQIILGYIINDRLGKPICGENTCSLPHGVLTLPRAGTYHATLAFRWPEIAPGEYTITLGVGEGRHPLRHAIQCWAHNVVAVSAVSPTKVIHCLFNNPIERVEVTPLG